MDAAAEMDRTVRRVDRNMVAWSEWVAWRGVNRKHDALYAAQASEHGYQGIRERDYSLRISCGSAGGGREISGSGAMVEACGRNGKVNRAARSDDSSRCSEDHLWYVGPRLSRATLLQGST